LGALPHPVSNLLGQLLVVVQSRLKEIQTLAQLELIPGLSTNLQETKPAGWTWDQWVDTPAVVLCAQLMLSPKIMPLIPGPMDLLNLSWQYTMVSLIESQD